MARTPYISYDADFATLFEALGIDIPLWSDDNNHRGWMQDDFANAITQAKGSIEEYIDNDTDITAEDEILYDRWFAMLEQTYPVSYWSNEYHRIF